MFVSPDELLDGARLKFSESDGSEPVAIVMRGITLYFFPILLLLKIFDAKFFPRLCLLTSGLQLLDLQERVLF